MSTKLYSIKNNYHKNLAVRGHTVPHRILIEAKNPLQKTAFDHGLEINSPAERTGGWVADYSQSRSSESLFTSSNSTKHQRSQLLIY